MELCTFENWLVTGMIFFKSLSKLYRLLIENFTSDKIMRERWKKDIHERIGEKDWQLSNRYIMNVSDNIAIRESYFKIRNRWYLTPSRMHKMSADNSPICWHCKTHKGTMIYVWWSCLKIRLFWKQIVNEICTGLGIFIISSPSVCLLHLHLNLNRLDTVLVNNLVLAARMLIVKQWLQEKKPYNIRLADKVSIFVLDEQVNSN